MRKALRSASGAVIYVARVGRRDQPVQSRPCRRCVATMHASGVSRVVWTTDSGMEAARVRDLYAS